MARGHPRSLRYMASPAHTEPVQIRVGIATAAAMGAVLVAIGLARSAFAPLQPALVADNWFTGRDAALLAAANLGGYLVGALIGAPLARRFPVAAIIRTLMVLVGLSFLACADESLPFAWFFGWRVVSGIAGGAIMALAGPAVLDYVAESRRAFVSQMTLYGTSIGIVIAGAIMPLLISVGVAASWIAIGAASLAITAVTWRMWPPSAPRVGRAVAPAPHRPRAGLFYLQYALVGGGVTVQMVFLVDYIARDLGRGVTEGSAFYLVYGVGALIGPFIYSGSTKRIGLRATLRSGFAVQFVATGLLLVSSSTAVLGIAAFLAGLGVPGLIAAFLLRSQEISGGDPAVHRSLWGMATASGGVGQAIAAFGTAYLIGVFGEQGNAYPILFIAGAVAMVIAFGLDLVIKR